ERGQDGPGRARQAEDGGYEGQPGGQEGVPRRQQAGLRRVLRRSARRQGDDRQGDRARAREVKVWRRRVERLFEWISVALMGVLAVEVLLGIVFRAARRPLAWYDEVASVLLAWLTYYGSTLAALKRAHIDVPGLVDALARGRHTAALVERDGA